MKPFGLAFASENEGLPARRSKQVEQYADGRSLARAIESEKSEYLPLLDFEMKVAYRREFPVAFCYSTD